MKKTVSFFKEKLLFLLLAVQPVLDAIAYWTQSDDGTIAGKIRLAIMIVTPLILLFKLEKKRNFVIVMAVMGVYSLLHILNGFRVGYINMYFDVSYLVRVLYMPVMAVCLVFLVNTEKKRDQLIKGVFTAACLTLLFFAVAVLTKTYNVTYAEGMGISGWVIDDNRCANSIILVSLTCFAVFFGIKSERKILNILAPLVCQIVLVMNGTKACYFGLLVILLAYLVFLLAEKVILKKKLKKTAVFCLAALLAVSVVIYPVTPRAKAAEDRASGAEAKYGEIEAAAAALGYDVPSMSPEERFNTPEVKAVFEHYYKKYMEAIPDLFTRFGTDAVLLHFNMSTDVAKLIDTRDIKICYSTLIWNETDFITKLVGFEVSEIGTEGFRDLENDWPAIFFYYGYLGLALYAGFILYFLLLVVKRLLKQFKGSFILPNFCALLCLVLQIGLAQFSGAILRMPNVSIYMAAVLAIIYYQTKRASVSLAGE